MLKKIKVYLGINDDEYDSLIELLIQFAMDAFEDYTGASAADHETVIIKMVIEDFNKYGSEGISALSFGGAKEDVLTNYSAPLLKQIRKHKKVKVM